MLHKVKLTSMCAAMLLGATAQSAEPPPMVSGQPIPVQTGTLKGRLAVGISTNAVGVINAANGKEASLFTTANTHSAKPGLFLYKFIERAPTGAPVFGDPVEVAMPNGTGKVPPPGTIFQTKDGAIHGFWLRGDELERTVFNPSANKFEKSPSGNLKLDALPKKPSFITVMQQPNGAIDLVLGINDGTESRPTDAPNWRDPAYRPFDGAGVYRGGWPFVYLFGARLESIDSSTLSDVRLVSPTEREALLNFGYITTVDLGAGRERDVLTGSWFGNLLYYRNTSTDGLKLDSQKLVADEDGVAIRHGAIRPSPIAYFNAQTGRRSDLIVGGEGALDYYRFTGKFTKGGAPIYQKPVPVLEQNAKLYPGSLPVLSAVDWNGDGAMDIIAGNSEGKIVFFRNRGTSEKPAFDDSVEIEAAGRPIHIQPGYNDVQGPQEARWGYVSPNVIDWNGDGLLDIVTSSATARHEVFLNIGSKTEPKLDASQGLYCRGLDLHGTWRVRPGVAKLGERMAYVALDDQDEFHLYWQIDPFNLEDGGKLKLEDGQTIRANFLHAGGTGRSKINLVDWDRDGKVDLLVGTPRHGSIPNPEKGLPQSKGLKGAAVVFLKNTGTNEAPVYAFPTLIQFKGEPIYLAQHECGPTTWDIGQADGPDLIVGNQDGRIMYYARKDLSWQPLE